MMKLHGNDTIAALATPPGEGAIAVIRISGPASLAVAHSVFRGTSSLLDAPGYTVHFGTIHDRDDTSLDQVLASVFRSPRSYTGEDLVEISCHGGMYVAGRILDSLIAAGARQAEPGEFTRRAFINGKIDLAQAEAVADMIRARSEQMRQASFEQLQGKLGERIRRLRGELTDLCGLLEVDLDFSEEGIGLISARAVQEKIINVDAQLQEMLSSFEHGKLAREGVEIVLIGKPNAGKSSIFNALLREERAIVTPHPGTTRDSLEENLTIGGMLFRVHDTAGLRETVDFVETEGVKRSQTIMTRADILLDVIDATSPLDRDELTRWKRTLRPSQKCLALYNKIDLLDRESVARLTLEPDSVLVSARTGEGLEELRRRLFEMVEVQKVEAVPVGVINSRHAASLQKAKEALGVALTSLEESATNEFIAFDVREAANQLAEITGEITSEEILNQIFARFCIGK